MTYDSQWKPEVDKIWAEYKLEWEATHPDEKPEKTRFEIMNEFMKDKFTEASPETFKEVEDYRQKLKDDSGEDMPRTNLGMQ